MRNLLISFFFFISITTILNAQDSSIELKSAPSDCGKYLIHGIIRSTQKSRPTIHLIVNEKSQSEHTFNFTSTEDDLGYNIHKNKDVVVTALILKKLNGTSGELSKVEKIETRIPNVLKSKDTGFHLLQKLECQK